MKKRQAESPEKGPVRTCVGCRTRKNREALRRFAVDADGMVVLDSRATLKGRGAYCCRSENCLQRFLKNKKRLSRAFRVQVQGWNEELKGVFRRK